MYVGGGNVSEKGGGRGKGVNVRPRVCSLFASRV